MREVLSLQGRDVGTVKVTMPIAWSTAMLAWGVQDFTAGYKKSGSYAAAILNIKWGTDYLLKTIVGNTTAPGNLKLIWQVGASRPHNSAPPAHSFLAFRLCLDPCRRCASSLLRRCVVSALL